MVNVYGKGAARLHQVMMKETSASDLLMRHRNRLDGIKTGAPPLSRKSMAVTYLLAMPVSIDRLIFPHFSVGAAEFLLQPLVIVGIQGPGKIVGLRPEVLAPNQIRLDGVNP